MIGSGDCLVEMKKILFIVIALLALPFISANTYGSNLYGCGIYGVGCSEDEQGEDEDSGGGGGGGGIRKQFDIKILDIESPVTLGESFDFMYFVKGVGEFNHDVVIDFWIEKDDNVVTSGSDVVFLGVNEEKTEAASLFLPGNIDSGVYKFVIKVSYGTIQAEAHRTIDIVVEDGKARIGSLFDIRFLLVDSVMTNSDELSTITVLENFGDKDTLVNLTFIIFDEDGDKLYEKMINVNVETEEIIRTSFEGLELASGKYTVVLETLYGDGVRDRFVQKFEIVWMSTITGNVIGWIITEGKWYFLWLLILIIFIWIILFVRDREKRKCKKMTKKIKYYDKETGKPPKGRAMKMPKKKKRVRRSRKSIHQEIRKEVGNL